jgi:hypothetical protein
MVVAIVKTRKNYAVKEENIALKSGYIKANIKIYLYT